MSGDPTLVDREELSEESWRLLEQAIRTGTITLQSGDVRELKATELVKVLQWVAGTTTVKKQKTIPLPEDFRRKKTERMA